MNAKQAKDQISENIIELFEIDKLPEERRAEMISKIGASIFQGVLLRVLPLLDEPDLAEYDRLIESGQSPEDLLDFFFEKVPNFMQIVVEESVALRKEATDAMPKD